MQLQFLNVALPRTVEYKGETVSTGIYKQPTDERLAVRRLNIDGDAQADLSVHGGVDKAVYAFPSEHYSAYQSELGQESYPPGQFGENLTTQGMLETEVRIGDRYRIGTALLEVSQPRSPCYKFAIKMDTAEALAVCINSALTGFYLRVLEEGEIGAGDAIELEHTETGAPTVDEIHRLYFLDRRNIDQLRRAVNCDLLADAFRNVFRVRLAELGGDA